MLTRREGDTSSAFELASLVTSESAPLLPTPPPAPPSLSLRRSHSGSSWLQAGLRCRTNIHTPRPASSLPPSFPLPLSQRPRPHCAARAAQSAARTGTSAAPPRAARSCPVSHQLFPDGTGERNRPASRAGPPDTAPG